MNREWQNWVARLLQAKPKAKSRASSARRPARGAPVFQIESLEDRVVPAGTITIIEAGPGSLDGFLADGTPGTIAAADGGGADGTLSRAALEAVSAAIPITITAQASIIFEAALNPINLPQTAVLNQFIAAGGSVSFAQQSDVLSTAGAALTLQATDQLSLGALVTNGGNITLIGNRMDLGAAISAGAGRVDVRPASNGHVINLGGADVIGTTLGLTNVELAQFTAGVVHIGAATNTGGIVISTPITQPAGFNVLSLETGNTGATAVNQAGTGSIAVDSVAIRSAGSVILNVNPNDIESLAVSVTTATHDLRLTDTDSLLVSTVDGLAGLSIADDITITAGGIVSQAVGANVTADQVDLLGTGPYILTNVGNDANTLAAALTANGTGTLSFTDADDLTIGTAGSTNGVVTNNSAVAINTVDGNLTVTNTRAGADVEAGTSTAFLSAGSAAGQDRVLALDSGVDAPIVSATGGVVLEADNISIATLAGFNNVNAGAATAVLRPFTAGTLIDLGGGDAGNTLGLTDAELDEVAAGVIVVGRADAGNAAGTISVTAPIDAANTPQLELETGGAIIDGGGSITETRLGLTAGAVIGAAGNTLDVSVSNLEATTPTGGIFVANTGTVLTIGGVNATLTGVRTGQNSITITNDNTIIVGATSAEGISIAGVTGSITVSNTAGSIAVNAAVANNGPGDVSLSAESDLTVNAPVSTGPGMITLRADNDNDGGNFASTAAGLVSTTGGAVDIRTSTTFEGDTVTIGGTVTVTGGAGDVTVAASGSVTVNAGVSVTGTGNIAVTADANNNGTGDYLSAATGSLETTTGNITVRGQNINVGGLVETDGGNILIDNTASNNNGTIAVNAPLRVTALAGNISVLSDDNVDINAVVSVAGTGTVTVTTNTNNITTSGAITTASGNIALTAEDNVSVGANVEVQGGTGTITIIAEPATSIPSAVNAAAGNFSSNAAGTIKTANGDIVIQAADSITVGGAITAGGTADITLFADAAFDNIGDAAINATITTAGGNVAVIATDTDITAAITTPAANQVFLLGRDPADVITLGADTVAALGLTQADLDNITTGILNVGGNVATVLNAQSGIANQNGIANQTGNISFVAPIVLAVAKVPVLSLETSGTGGIVDNVPGEATLLTVRDLALRAGAGIGSADDLDVSISNLAALNSPLGTATGNIFIENTGVALLTIVQNIDGVTVGVTNNATNGDITVSTVGQMVIDAWVFTSGGGDNDITLTTTGANAGIVKSATGLVNSTGGGTGDILVDASGATSGGSITVTRNPVFFDFFASGTGDVTLLANDGVTLNDDAAGVLIHADNGDVSITSNATDPAGMSDVYVGTNATIETEGDVTITADEGNGIGGGITMADDSKIRGSSSAAANNVTLVAAKDIRVTTIDADIDITVTVTGNLGNIVDDTGATNQEGTILTAGNDVILTSGGRIGGQSPLTTAHVESEATGAPATEYLALIDVNYGNQLQLAQIGALGNIQIRRVGAGINTSDVVGEAGTLVGSGNQLALVSDDGNFVVDDNFSFNGANNSDLFFATVDGNSFVINPAASLVNTGATATTSLMVSGSTAATITGPAADNNADITVTNLRLFTTGGDVGTSAASPLEFNAVTLGGFTNGKPNGVTPAATSGDAFLTDTDNGIALARFDASNATPANGGDVTLVSRGLIQTGTGIGSSIISVAPNDGVADVLGDVLILDATLPTSSGNTGQIGYFAGGAGQFVEVDVNQLNAKTNNSRAWISAITGTQIGTAFPTNIGIDVGTNTLFLKSVNGIVTTGATGNPDVDIVAGQRVVLIGENGGFGGLNARLQIDSPVLNADVTGVTTPGQGDIYVQGNQALLTVNSAKTTGGLVSLGTLNGNMQIGSAPTANGNVVNATGTVFLNTGPATGNVTIGTGTSTATQIVAGDTVTIAAAGSIVSGTPGAVKDVQAPSLDLVAAANAGVAGAAINTTVGTLAGQTTTGDFFVTNTGDLIIGTVSGTVGVTATAGIVNISAASAITVNDDVFGAVSVTLAALGSAGTDDLTVNADVTSNGPILLTAADAIDVNGTGTVDSSASTTTLTAGTNVSIDAGSTVESATGTTVTATAGTLTTGGTVNTTAGATDLNAGTALTVTGGSIDSTTGTTLDATTTLDVDAGTIDSDTTTALTAGGSVGIDAGATVDSGTGTTVTATGGSLTVGGTVTSGATTDLNAFTSLTVTGNIDSTTGTTLDADTIDVDAGTVDSNATTALTAGTSVGIDAGASVTSGTGTTVTATAGTLTVGGTVGSGATTDLNAGTDLTVQAGAAVSATGATTLDFGTAAAGDALIAGTVSGATVTATGGAGADTLTVDFTAGASLPNNLAFNGGALADELLVTDAGSATGRTYTISGTQVSRSGTSISIASVELVDVAGGTGADTFNVTAAAATAFDIHGNSPTGATGDTLAVTGAGAAFLTTSQTGSGATATVSGTFDFPGATPDITFDTIETIDVGNADAVRITKTSNYPTSGAVQAVPGTSVVYTVVVTNFGNVGLTGLPVSDTLPAQIAAGAVLTSTTYTSGASTGTASVVGNVLTASANLAPGESATYVITGTLIATTQPTVVTTVQLSNTATVTPPAGVTNLTGTDTQTVASDITPQVNLSVTKDDGSATAVPGTSTVYTIVVTNTGPSTVTIPFTDAIPTGVTSFTRTVTNAGLATGGTSSAVSAPINDTLTLPTGGTVTYVVTAFIDPAATGSLVNTAALGAVPTGYADTGGTADNTATDTDTLNVTGDVSVTKSNGVTTVTAGTTTTYTIVVSNTGPSTVIVPVADTFPAVITTATRTFLATPGASGATAGSGNLNDTLTLPPGSTVTYTVQAVINPAAPAGTLVNTATLTPPGTLFGNNTANDSATDTDTLLAAPDLSVIATAPATGKVGTPFTYTFTVTNNGASTQTAVVLTHVLPVEAIDVTSASTQGTTAVAGGLLTATIGTLAPGATVTVTVTLNPTDNGVFNLTASVAGAIADSNPANNTATAALQVAPYQPLIIAGPGNGGGGQVRALNADTGALERSFTPFGADWASSISVAQGDINGDGVPEVIVGAGPGGAPRVIVYDLRSGAVLRDYFAYAPNVFGGVNVSAGDLDGDGKDEVITGAGAGFGPHVKAYSGATGAEIRSFFAYAPNFTGGVRVAAGDINGDGKVDIVTGAGGGGSSHVKAFDGTSLAEFLSFFAYGSGLREGVYVSTGDLNGDGIDEIITGAGGGGSAHVRAFDGVNLAEKASFFAFAPTARDGVSVGSTDRNSDGIDEIVAGTGVGVQAQVKEFNIFGQEKGVFNAFDIGFIGGVFVG